MSDKDTKKDADGENDKEKGKWSTGAKVGAAVGSAAIAAALIFAGRHQMKKHDNPKKGRAKGNVRYENEPDQDDDA